MKGSFARSAVVGGAKTLLGMVHLQPLPGTPFHEPGSLPAIRATAVASALALQEGGMDGCLVQTVDRVYSPHDDADPARTAAMATIVAAVVEATGGAFHVGVQMMRNAVRPSLAVAAVTGGTYVRAGAFVGRSRTVHGIIEGQPEAVLHYRKLIDAEDVAVVAEMDSGHHRVEPPLTLAQLAKAAAAAGAVAVSLGHADHARTLQSIACVRAAAPDLPVLLTGHTSHTDAARMLAASDGAFVGTCLERDGWGSQIDSDRVRDYVAIVRGIEDRL